MSRRTVPAPSPRPVRHVVSALRRVAFWATVLFPAVYLVALSTPLDGRQYAVFGGLVVVNVLCLLLGHEYSPGR